MLYLVIFTTLFNCKSKNESIYFNREKYLISKDIDYDKNKLLIGFPSLLVAVDSCLVTLSFQGNNYIKILDLKEHRICEMGAKWKGPGEIAFPTDLSLNRCSFKSFDVYDYGKKTVNVFNIDSCRIHKKSNPIEIIKAIKSSFKSYNICDDKNLNTGLFDNKFPFSVSNKDSIFYKFGDYDYNPQDNNSLMNKCMAYQGNYRLQDSNFVRTCTNAQIIEIYKFDRNLHFHLVKKIVGSYVNYKSGNSNKGYSSPINSDSPFAYLDVATSKKYMYLLYSGKKPKEFRKNNDYIKGSEIHVLDWKGNSIVKLKLNKNVVNISYSEKENRIYAITHDPEPKLIYFEL